MITPINYTNAKTTSFKARKLPNLNTFEKVRKYEKRARRLDIASITAGLAGAIGSMSACIAAHTMQKSGEALKVLFLTSVGLLITAAIAEVKSARMIKIARQAFVAIENKNFEAKALRESLKSGVKSTSHA